MSAVSTSRPEEVVAAPRADWPEDAVEAVARLNETVSALTERAEQLQRALESRIVIEQAKGVLAERLGVEPATAFELLRRAARSRQMRLHQLAGAVVASPATPPPVAHEVARLRREPAS